MKITMLMEFALVTATFDVNTTKRVDVPKRFSVYLQIIRNIMCWQQHFRTGEFTVSTCSLDMVPLCWASALTNICLTRLKSRSSPNPSSIPDN